MRQDAMLVLACRENAATVRAVILANAVWAPVYQARPDKKPEKVGGVARLSYRFVKAPHPDRKPRTGAPGNTTILHALVDAEAGGWLKLRTAGTAPGKAGSSQRLAATFDVPHRHGAGAPRVTMPPNVARPEGKLRLHSARIRVDAAELAGPELKVLIYAAAHRDRDEEGGVVDPSPFPLPVRDLAERLRLPVSTTADAITGLVEKGRLAVEQPGSGRRPTLYQLAAVYVRRFRRTDAEE